MIRLCFLLMFTFAGATDEQQFLTKTVHVGEDVSLTCSRLSSEGGVLFWVKLAPGHLPDVLAAAYTFDGGVVNTTPRVTARKDYGTFVLSISNTKLSDTAFYYCEKIIELKRTIIDRISLIVKGPEPNVITVIQPFTPDPIRPGDAVTLQCSVLSPPDNRTCLAGPIIYWFRANDSSNCTCVSSETPSSQTCVCSFSKNISSSDAGTYRCAVATCGHILFGNGAKLDIDGTKEANEWLYVLSAALTLCVIIIVLLIYIIKRNPHNCFTGSAFVAPTNDQQSQNVSEDPLIYAVTHFVKRKPVEKQMSRTSDEDEATIYSDVRVLE